MSTLAEIAIIGVIATLVGDVWQILLQRVAGVPASRWGLVGRWLGWMRRGVFFHHPISATPRLRGETAIGWAFHYAIGIAYAALYVALLRLLPAATPLAIPALALALVLLIAPWFVMQPALGLGIMASKTPHPAAARAASLLSHAVFGLGLYGGALIWLAAFAR